MPASPPTPSPSDHSVYLSANEIEEELKLGATRVKGTGALVFNDDHVIIDAYLEVLTVLIEHFFRTGTSDDVIWEGVCRFGQSLTYFCDVYPVGGQSVDDDELSPAVPERQNGRDAIVTAVGFCVSMMAWEKVGNINSLDDFKDQ
jgi:hypothetical protein